MVSPNAEQVLFELRTKTSTACSRLGESVMVKDLGGVMLADSDLDTVSGKNLYSPIAELRQSIRLTSGETYTLHFESFGDTAADNAALLELRILDEYGSRIETDQFGNRSKSVGEFIYVKSGSEQDLARQTVTFTAPDAAVSLEIVGHQWRSGTQTFIVGEIFATSPAQKFNRNQYFSGYPLATRGSAFSQEVRLGEADNLFSASITHRGISNFGSVPLIIEFYNKDSEKLLPVGDLPINTNHGPCLVIWTSADEKTEEFQLEAPNGAERLVLRGVPFGDREYEVIGDISLTVETGSSANINRFIDSIPDSDTLFIIDTTAPPMGRETQALRPNNLSLEYIAKGIWVIFLPFSSIQEFSPNPHPRLLQLNRADFDQMVDKVAKTRQGSNNVYICSSFPSFKATMTAHRLKLRGWKVVYEVRDDMEEFNRVGYSKWYTPELERMMLRSADRVVSVSSALDEKIVSLSPDLANHTVIPNGVRSEVIEAGEPLRTMNQAEVRNQKRKVGYVGHLTSSWFDWELLKMAADKFPQLEFEMVGPGAPNNLALPENITLYGPMTHNEILDLVGEWAVGLIPFKETPLTKSVDPNKIYEYFAWGMRCISAPMGLVHEYPSTYVYNDEAEFLEALREATSLPIDAKELEQLDNFLKSCSWTHRAESMLDFMEVEVD